MLSRFGSIRSHLALAGMGVVLLLASVIASAHAAQVDFHATVLSVDGSATITRGQSTFKAQKAAYLHDGDRVVVEKGSITLTWPDGSKARLMAGTRVRLTNAPQATADKAALTHLEVDAGSVFLNVIHEAPRPSRFEVRTNKSMGAVEGTLVEYTWNPTTEESTVRVWRGKVQCSFEGPDGHTVMCDMASAGIQHAHQQKGQVGPALNTRLNKGAWPGP